MRFEKIAPSPALSPYIAHFVITENNTAQTYQVLPTTGLVMGFQYQGRLAVWEQTQARSLAPIGITGLQDTYKNFINTAGIGSVLVFFKTLGAYHFFTNPLHELFEMSVSMDNFAPASYVAEVEERLAIASNDQERIKWVEHFLMHQLHTKNTDNLVEQAVKLIYQTHGNIKMKSMADTLCISQSPFEKRFRKIIGTSPKKFASIVRFQKVMQDLANKLCLLTEIAYQNHYFDQAHFIKDFQKFAGNTPEAFRKML